jgi:ABC-type oligopeptide transport system substrate-binding subunit
MLCFTYRSLLLPACLLLSCSLILTACGGGSGANSTSASQTNLTGNSANTAAAASTSAPQAPTIPTRITNTRGALLDGKLLKLNTLAETTQAIQAPTPKPLSSHRFTMSKITA